MNTRLTLFTAALVQDSALSVSGIDRESSSGQPFALVDGVPTLAGRGLKGAAVAMARRFFCPLPESVSLLPRSVSEKADRKPAYLRSAWEFSNTTPEEAGIVPRLRAGVGIRHKTGARAKGVLYDREVIPAGTRWPLVLRVDWSLAPEDGCEAEGILGYVLARQWALGRCWLGGGVARGLGWCHVEDLRAYRLEPREYDRWVESERKTLPSALPEVPTVEPTRSWCFRTLDLKLSFGEYRPEAGEPAWGLDMFAVGPHDSERTVQATGDGIWARPSWAATSDPTPDALFTDRALLMEGGLPLLPGSSLRGPLRHAFSRATTAAGFPVQDPHSVQGAVDSDDPGGKVFGTVTQSSRVLIRDGRAEGEWAAARLHMHAEDEFSAGSYGSAKRDAVRLLRGVFPIRIVIEGARASDVDPLVANIDRLVALGEIGHLPVGGHKTRGAGWGHWRSASWSVEDVSGVPRPLRSAPETSPSPPSADRGSEAGATVTARDDVAENTYVHVTNGGLDFPGPTLGKAADAAREMLGEHRLTAWWCDPATDLDLREAPAVFGREWPEGKALLRVRIDEVAFYADRAVWRAARTMAGAKWVFIEEVGAQDSGARPVAFFHTPARLHGSTRFSAVQTDRADVLLREWHVDGQMLGFTLSEKP